jgi:hypothetical protein
MRGNGGNDADHKDEKPSKRALKRMKYKQEWLDKRAEKR